MMKECFDFIAVRVEFFMTFLLLAFLGLFSPTKTRKIVVQSVLEYEEKIKNENL